MGIHDSNIIKWYQYKIVSDEDLNESDSDSENMDSVNSLEDTDGENSESTSFDDPDHIPTIEEDAARLGIELDDDNKDLVADILSRFKDAQQSSVDSLFSDINNDLSFDSPDNIATNQEPMSEEDLIRSICAPKQNNVDQFVKQASDN